MKNVKLFILVLVAMFAIIGCSNDKDGNDNTDGDVNNNANNNQQVENNDQDGANESNANSGEMKLGETGFVDDGISQYEITPKSVEIFTERNGITPSNDDEVFALIDYTVKNTGEEAFQEEDILVGAGLSLTNSQGNIATEITYYDYDFVDEITESIEPGNSYDSQMLFEVPESETSEYTLHFESYSPDVEDAKWLFTESEAK